MNYVVTTEPTTEPVTLAALKNVLRLTTCDFDEELSRILTTARRQVENDSNRKLVTQTVKLLMDDFPAGDTIELRLPPAQSVTSVKYFDTAGSEQTLSSSNYWTDTDSTPPRIVLKDGNNWPSVNEDQPNAVIIEMQCGYGAISAVPAEAVLAILEFAKQTWSGCDNPMEDVAYSRLLSHLRWTEYHCV